MITPGHEAILRTIPFLFIQIPYRGVRMSWIAIARFDVADPEAQRAKKHWEEAAEDLGLLAEGSVHLEQEETQLTLFISETLNEFFRGQPGSQYF